MGRTEDVKLTVLCLIEDGNKILLQNRVKKEWHGYTLPGGHVEPSESFVDLTVRMDENGTMIFANTADNLDPVTVGRLFDRFYTVEAARNSTGLGLSIAKELTERMGGHISAEYQDNKIIVQLVF